MNIREFYHLVKDEYPLCDIAQLSRPMVTRYSQRCSLSSHVKSISAARRVHRLVRRVHAWSPPTCVDTRLYRVMLCDALVTAYAAIIRFVHNGPLYRTNHERGREREREVLRRVRDTQPDP